MPVSSIDLSKIANFRVPHGNTKTVLFRLRREGTTQPLDVSSADKIAVEWTKDGVAQLPIEADSLNAQADWILGDVPVVLGRSDILAEVGTYPYSLTVFYTGVTHETVATGVVEVYTRPGYPYP